MGQRLLASGHPLTSGIHQALAAVEQELDSLQKSWQRRWQQLQQVMEQQVGPGQLPACPAIRTWDVPTTLVKGKAEEAAFLG